jgi:hypothetical protein
MPACPKTEPAEEFDFRSALPRLTIVGPVALFVALLLSSCAGERSIAINDRIHHDDFEYLVTGLAVTDKIGPAASQNIASGRFYIVTFEVENRALRVDHVWDNSIAYVVDELGYQYENQPELQARLNMVEPFNYAPKHRTAAGATESTKLVFRLPKNVIRPCLMVRGELLMGDVFDGKAFARTKVRLF